MASSLLIRHGLTYLWAKVLPSIINFAAVAIYTRLASPAEFGTYTTIVAAVTLANSTIFQWLRLSLLRFYSSYANKKTLETTLLSIFIALSAVSLGVAGVIAAWLPPIGSYVLFGAVLLVLTAWFEMSLELLRAKLKPSGFAIASIGRAIAALGVSSLLLLVGAGVWALLIGLGASLFIGSLAALRGGWSVDRLGKPAKSVITHTFQYGFPLSVGLTFSTAIRSSDRLLLTGLSGADVAGLYAAGYLLAQSSLEALILAINSAGYPLAVNALESKGVDAARQQIRSNTGLLFGISVPATVGIAMLAEELAVVTLGGEFVQAASSIIPLIAVAIFLSGARGNYIDHAFHLGKKPWLLTAVLAVSALLNVGGIVVLIPTYGTIGAAWASVAAYAIALVLAIPLSRKAFPLPFPGREIWQILVATAFMAVVISLIAVDSPLASIVIKVIGGSVVYGIVLVLLNAFNLRTWIRGRWTHRAGSA